MRKLMAVVVLAVALVGCQTGIGRAVTYAFSGVPEEVPQAYDLVEMEYLRLSSQEVSDIEAGKAETAEGQARRATLLQDRLQIQRAVLEALKALRSYSGAASEEEAAAARAAALQRRLEILQTLGPLVWR